MRVEAEKLVREDGSGWCATLGHFDFILRVNGTHGKDLTIVPEEQGWLGAGS